MANEPLTDAEAIMWRLQRTPGMSSTFGSITLLDRSPKLAVLRQRMANAAAALPRLRSTIHDDDNPLNPPVWQIDPDFRIEDHVRHISLPAPGRLSDLISLATQVINDPLDPHKPQWQFVVIDGIRSGPGGPKAALVQHTHHAIADGEASIEMSLYFLDLERNAKQPLVGPPDDVADAVDETPVDSTGGSGVWHELASGLRLTANVAKGLRGAIGDPAAIAAQLGESGGAKSPLWTGRSLRHQIETIDLPMGPLREAAKRLGGTLNTAFVTVVAEAASRYHRDLGSPIDELRMSMAISSRSADDSREGNAFGLARMTVPAGEMPIADRFAAIHEATLVARSGGAATLSFAASLMTAMPTALVSRLARQQSGTVDLATSNVRAAPCPMYLGGAKVLSTYPIGPLMGVPGNITMMSYDGVLNIGMNIDPGAITEPTRLAKGIVAANRALVGRKRPQ